MTKKKGTFRALLSSVLALVLCMSMLIGTTFAWFTDSVTSGSNVIKSGNLDIEVQYTLDGTNWADLDGAADLFKKGLWEPGHTEVVALKIINKGSLALKYNASMNIVNEVVGKTKDGKDIKLSEILTVERSVVEDSPMNRPIVGMWFNKNSTLTNPSNTLLKDATVFVNDQDLLPGAAHYVMVRVDMAETVGNEANHDGTNVPSINFGVNVVATQVPHEEDTFGTDYDANAEYPTVANTSEELKAAVAEKEANVVLPAGEFDTNFKVAGGSDITITGNGKDTVLNGQIATTASNAGTITLRNLTVNVDGNIADSTGISQTGKSAIALWGDQTVICENVTFNMSLADSTAITSWWDTGKGTSIIVRNCTFNCNGQRPIRATGNVTIENCTFNDPYRYAVQLTAKASTATELDKAIINFKNNKIVNGPNGKAFVYGIQLEGADYGCNNCVINGSGNTIENGGADSAMYYCECGKVEHDTITWNTEVAAVHKN